MPSASPLSPPSWISLQKTRREIDFPWKVQEIGYLPRIVDSKSEKAKPAKNTFLMTDQLEFCIRISPTTDSALHQIDGVEYVNSFPHIHVKLPHQRYVLRRLAPRDVYYFIYPPEYVQPLRQIGLFDDNLCWDIRLTPEILARLNELRNHLVHAREFSVADKIDLQTFALLEELAFQRKSKGVTADGITSKIEKIAQYFRLHYADNLLIEDIAAEHGFSRSSFFRNWHRIFTVTPARFVTGLRLDEAKRLLLETEYTIEDIANQLRFCDPAYFCSAFKREFHITPAGYRTLNKQTAQSR